MNPRACALILNNQKQLLLIYRVNEGREYWVYPGGSVEPGESFEAAAIREVLEETSLSVSGPIMTLENLNAGRLERYFRFRNISGTVTLGIGPEAERASDTNIYKPVWLSRNEFLMATVVPGEIKSKVVEWWLDGGR